jgi:cystathionine beta-lyase family protein involved in aluminum resistance
MLQVERKQRELRATLLKCIRYVDVLESRFANASGYNASDIGKQRMEELSKKLSSLETEVSPVGQKGAPFSRVPLSGSHSLW